MKPLLMISANTLIAAGPDNPSKAQKQFVIPPHAAEISPGIFHIGTALDKERVIEGYAIVKGWIQAVVMNTRGVRDGRLKRTI